MAMLTTNIFSGVYKSLRLHVRLTSKIRLGYLKTNLLDVQISSRNHPLSPRTGSGRVWTQAVRNTGKIVMSQHPYPQKSRNLPEFTQNWIQG